LIVGTRKGTVPCACMGKLTSEFAMRPDQDQSMTRKSAGLTGFGRLQSTRRLLYHSQSPKVQRFQMSVLVVDLAIIGFFIASPLLREYESFLWIDYSIALLLAADLTARALASTDMSRW